jgi:hypothetical protein
MEESMIFSKSLTRSTEMVDPGKAMNWSRARTLNQGYPANRYCSSFLGIYKIGGSSS